VACFFHGAFEYGPWPRSANYSAFGRGVRIKGKNMTLQRSGHPDLSTLETLFIYGIKANYLEQFLEAIRKEGVDYEEILVPFNFGIRKNGKNWLYLSAARQNRLKNVWSWCWVLLRTSWMIMANQW